VGRLGRAPARELSAIARHYTRAPLNERVIAWSWWLKEAVLSDYVSDSAPIVIGGCGRSGTTLLQVLFDAHPELCCVRESSILQPGKLHTEKLAQRFKLLPRDELLQLARSSRRHGEFVDRVFAEFCQRSDASVWAEKSPKNVRRLDAIFRHFPKARFVHVIRDGRDSVCSLRRHNRTPDDLRPVADCARRWTDDVTAGLAWRSHINYREVRYEDLVSDLEGTLRTLLESLGESFSSEMLEYHRKQSAVSSDPNFKKPIFGTSVERWRRDLTAAELQEVRRLCGPLLIELGYAQDDSWAAAREAQQGHTP
jgi:protein-tyrosine sulfotransferase